MVFPVTIILGPSVEYKMYIECVNNTKIPQGNKRFRWVGQNMLLSFVFLTYFLHPADWESILDSAQKGAHGWPYRVLCILAKAHWCRYKYFGPWLFTNALVIICGMGYEDGSWEHSVSLFAGRVELARRPRDFIASWNCGTQRFLKYYVYVRGPISAKTGRVHPMMMYVTNAVSALWHGWYAGYLVTFGSVVLVTFIEKWYYALFPLAGYEGYKPYGVILTGEEKLKKREIKERKEKRKIREQGQGEEPGQELEQGQGMETGKHAGFYVRAVVEWLCLQFVIDYSTGAFFVLTWDRVKRLYGFVDYCGTFVIVGLFVVFFTLSCATGKGKESKRKKSRSGKAQGEARGRTIEA